MTAPSRKQERPSPCPLREPEEHPAPNIEWHRESSLTSAFDVRCWMFDVFSRLRRFKARMFISGKSLPIGWGEGGRRPGEGNSERPHCTGISVLSRGMSL